MTNITFSNFRSLASLYGLDINQYWQNTFEPDTGAVALSNLVFRNFSGKFLCIGAWNTNPKKTNQLYYKTGSVADGSKRPPLYLIANDLTFALNVTVEDFTVWTESGTQIINKISNVFGVGDDSYGANNGIKNLTGTESPYSYTSSYTVTATPTNWESPTTPSWAAPSTGYGSKL